MNEKKILAENLLDAFENNTIEAKIIFQKIFNTLFEKNFGLFARRNISTNLKSQIISKNKELLQETVEHIMITDPNSESSTYIFGKSNSKNKGYKYEIDGVTIYIMLDVNKNSFYESEINEDGYEGEIKDYENKNIIIISLMELNKTQKEIPIFYYYKDLLFNLTKNKYVPHIENVDGKNITAFTEKDIKDNNLPKIKRSDKLIKFYGFPKSSICKITYKMNKIDNIDLYCNYKIVI